MIKGITNMYKASDGIIYFDRKGNTNLPIC